MRLSFLFRRQDKPQRPWLIGLRGSHSSFRLRGAGLKRCAEEPHPNSPLTASGNLNLPRDYLSPPHRNLSVQYMRCTCTPGEPSARTTMQHPARRRCCARQQTCSASSRSCRASLPSWQGSCRTSARRKGQSCSSTSSAQMPGWPPRHSRCIAGTMLPCKAPFAGIKNTIADFAGSCMHQRWHACILLLHACMQHAGGG